MDEFLHGQINQLQNMNISYTIMPNKEHKLEQQWEDAFTKDISKSQKRKMAFKQCMWNVFSWGKRVFKRASGDRCFRFAEKGVCYLFFHLAKMHYISQRLVD